MGEKTQKRGGIPAAAVPRGARTKGLLAGLPEPFSCLLGLGAGNVARSGADQQSRARRRVGRARPRPAPALCSPGRGSRQSRVRGGLWPPALSSFRSAEHWSSTSRSLMGQGHGPPSPEPLACPCPIAKALFHPECGGLRALRGPSPSPSLDLNEMHPAPPLQLSPAPPPSRRSPLSQPVGSLLKPTGDKRE